MNPPYVRNERLPKEPRVHYRKVFNDVAAMNADIFTYFVRKTIDALFLAIRENRYLTTESNQHHFGTGGSLYVVSQLSEFFVG